MDTLPRRRNIDKNQAALVDPVIRFEAVPGRQPLGSSN
jgi:hypothetical protein